MEPKVFQVTGGDWDGVIVQVVEGWETDGQKYYKVSQSRVYPADRLRKVTISKRGVVRIQEEK